MCRTWRAPGGWGTPFPEYQLVTRMHNSTKHGHGGIVSPSPFRSLRSAVTWQPMVPRRWPTPFRPNPKKLRNIFVVFLSISSTPRSSLLRAGSSKHRLGKEISHLSFLRLASNGRCSPVFPFTVTRHSMCDLRHNFPQHDRDIQRCSPRTKSTGSCSVGVSVLHAQTFPCRPPRFLHVLTSCWRTPKDLRSPPYSRAPNHSPLARGNDPVEAKMWGRSRIDTRLRPSLVLVCN